MLDEVNYLSNRTSELEENSMNLPVIQENLNKLTKKNNLLLNLLGEKEEELEAAMEDMKEMKHLYRKEIEGLLNQVINNRSD